METDTQRHLGHVTSMLQEARRLVPKIYRGCLLCVEWRTDDTRSVGSMTQQQQMKTTR